MRIGDDFLRCRIVQPFAIGDKAVFVAPGRERQLDEPQAVIGGFKRRRRGPPLVERAGNKHLARVRSDQFQTDGM